MHVKDARPAYPVHELIAKRWSPYAYSERAVSDADLRALFEAARWAPSSYNEQPWRYVVARKQNADEHARLLSCLVEPNQAWAKHAPVLALGVVMLRFSRNDKPNRAAQHDLGLAAGNLCAEATARGLLVHQMIGIVPDRARELYSIPEGAEPLTAIAIGYAAPSDFPDEGLLERDRSERTRRPLRDFVFGSTWSTPADFL